MSKTHALTVLSAAGKIALGANLNTVGKTLNDQLTLIRSADPMIAKRATLVGVAFGLVKDALDHGEFGPWLDKHIDDLGRRQVNYYMKLAHAALEEMKVDITALQSAPIADFETALTLTTGPGAKLGKAIETFVGDQSLADLLNQYCGKARTVKKKTTTEAVPAATEAEKEKSLQDRFNDVEEAVKLAVAGVTDKANWMGWSKQQHQDLHDIFETAANRVTEVFIKTHGRKSK